MKRRLSRSLLGLFRSHPREQGETYLEHCRFALSVGGAMVAAGLACLVHAVFPFWFKTTASRTIRMLGDRIQRRPPEQKP